MTRPLILAAALLWAAATSANARHINPVCYLETGERIKCGEIIGVSDIDRIMKMDKPICFMKLSNDVPDGEGVMAWNDGNSCHLACIIGYYCGPDDPLKGIK